MPRLRQRAPAGRDGDQHLLSTRRLADHPQGRGEPRGSDWLYLLLRHAYLIVRSLLLLGSGLAYLDRGARTARRRADRTGEAGSAERGFFGAHRDLVKISNRRSTA
jgi:hypothetical protein